MRGAHTKYQGTRLRFGIRGVFFPLGCELESEGVKVRGCFKLVSC
jgi:hypothetical protein